MREAVVLWWPNDEACQLRRPRRGFGRMRRMSHRARLWRDVTGIVVTASAPLILPRPTAESPRTRRAPGAPAAAIEDWSGGSSDMDPPRPRQRAYESLGQMDQLQRIPMDPI